MIIWSDLHRRANNGLRRPSPGNDPEALERELSTRLAETTETAQGMRRLAGLLLLFLATVAVCLASVPH